MPWPSRRWTGPGRAVLWQRRTCGILILSPFPAGADLPVRRGPRHPGLPQTPARRAEPRGHDADRQRSTNMTPRERVLRHWRGNSPIVSRSITRAIPGSTAASSSTLACRPRTMKDSAGHCRWISAQSRRAIAGPGSTKIFRRAASWPTTGAFVRGGSPMRAEATGTSATFPSKTRMKRP